MSGRDRPYKEEREEAEGDSTETPGGREGDTEKGGTAGGTDRRTEGVERGGNTGGAGATT